MHYNNAMLLIVFSNKILAEILMYMDTSKTFITLSEGSRIKNLRNILRQSIEKLLMIRFFLQRYTELSTEAFPGCHLFKYAQQEKSNF